MTINDELVSGLEGQSLLNLIREQGIELPTLCHLDGLEARGGCRLCLVEVQATHRLLPACTTTVQEGMAIYTHSERLVKYRRMILELLFAERNHVCAVCVMNGRYPTDEDQRTLTHAGDSVDEQLILQIRKAEAPAKK
jgi:bidirectional [NiFe] hydrogenase diaphorase subunit